MDLIFNDEIDLTQINKLKNEILKFINDNRKDLVRTLKDLISKNKISISDSELNNTYINSIDNIFTSLYITNNIENNQDLKSLEQIKENIYIQSNKQRRIIIDQFSKDYNIPINSILLSSSSSSSIEKHSLSFLFDLEITSIYKNNINNQFYITLYGIDNQNQRKFIGKTLNLSFTANLDIIHFTEVECKQLYINEINPYTSFRIVVYVRPFNSLSVEVIDTVILSLQSLMEKKDIHTYKTNQFNLTVTTKVIPPFV